MVKVECAEVRENYLFIWQGCVSCFSLVFTIQQVNAPPDSLEYLGTKRKFWFQQDGQKFLFKAEERGTGEDWAEKLVCEFARLLGLPHVEYEMAFYAPESLHGVICPNLAPRPLALIMGNQLLHHLDEQYPRQLRKKFGIPKYTVEAVVSVLKLMMDPTGPSAARVPPEAASALGTFVGYMLLDVWTANQDRHHENWGGILSADRFELAPTFDHGSALARNLTDAERQDRLTTTNAQRTVGYFVGRAMSEFYPQDGPKPLPLLDVFHRFTSVHPPAARAWLARLQAVTPAQVDDILAQVPPERMSEVTRRFTREVLTLNRIRLLQSYTI